MAKVRLKEVSKELNQKTGVILNETERVKRNADVIMQMLRQQENHFLRVEEEERQRIRYEKQQEIMKQQTKAWTMPDDDVPVEAIVEAAAAQAAAPEKAEEAPAVAEQPKAAPAAETKPAEMPAPVEAVREEAPAAPKAEPAAAPKKAEEAPAVAEQPKAAPPAAAPAEKKAPPAAKETAPAAKAEPARPARPAPRPVQHPMGPRSPLQPPSGARPAQPAAGEQRYGRPAYPDRPYGRPAASQQGQPRQQQRPPAAAGEQRYGRPAGPYGQPARSAGQAPAGQRPYGKPAAGGGRSSARSARPASDELMPIMEKERVSNYDPNKKNYNRQADPERVSRSKRQQARGGFSGYDDDVVRGGKRSRSRKPSAQQLMAPIRIEKAYMTAEQITVRDLTERIGKPAGDILKKLLMLGNMATINSELDYDTASLVASEFGVELELKIEKSAEEVLTELEHSDDDENMQPRPPVITIMGHVDHGKTSLLDYIRSAKVTASEAGGITQHIGAYQVEVDGQKITFLDTPGHEAFTAMRARGAQATDIAVLVVAADDGVMPQTVEAINHAKAADVPIIVAINKMDKPTANPERIKQDLTSYNLVAEEWGGDTIMVPVSALTGEGVDSLLEMILLQAEVLQLKANPDRQARGIIIEAKLDRSQGPLATVLLQNGTLRVGDNIVAGMASGRVRALINDRGERVESAGPATPVEISGFGEVPQAGDEMLVSTDDRLSRQVAAERREREREQRVAASSRVSLDNLFENIAEGKMETLNLIIKADVQGSVEAVQQALEKLSNEQVKVRVLHAGVGAISCDDVNLASAFNAIIIGFNIRPDVNARAAAEAENIDVRLYRVIYQATEDIQKAMKGLLEPVLKETIAGHAEVRNVFRITGSGTIAGCYVTDGKMHRNYQVRLLRDNVVIHEGKLSSLRRFKDDVREVNEGYECGIGLDGYNDIKERDVIECFTMEEVE
ncbi:MAG: translation initiation factor IF-2 [Christensenellales bacterium]|jgi:translation initiation factor IF-2